jgi:hypothetical protein
VLLQKAKQQEIAFVFNSATSNGFWTPKLAFLPVAKVSVMFATFADSVMQLDF